MVIIIIIVIIIMLILFKLDIGILMILSGDCMLIVIRIIGIKVKAKRSKEINKYKMANNSNYHKYVGLIVYLFCITHQQV